MLPPKPVLKPRPVHPADLPEDIPPPAEPYFLETIYCDRICFSCNLEYIESLDPLTHPRNFR